jgi:hypothetical protein
MAGLDAERWLDRMTEAWFEEESDASEAPTPPYLAVLASRLRALINHLGRGPSNRVRVASELNELIRSIVHNIDARTWPIDARAPDVGRQVRVRSFLRQARTLLARGATILRSSDGSAYGTASVPLGQAFDRIAAANRAWSGATR